MDEVICNQHAAVNEIGVCADPHSSSQSAPLREGQYLRVPSATGTPFVDKFQSPTAKSRSLRGSDVLLVPAEIEKLLPAQRSESLVDESSPRHCSLSSPRSSPPGCRRKRGPDGGQSALARSSSGRRPNGSMPSAGKLQSRGAEEQDIQTSEQQLMIESGLTEESAAQTQGPPSPSTTNSIQAFYANTDSLHVSFTSASTCTQGDDDRRYRIQK